EKKAHVDVTRAKGQVWANPTVLEQILTNLISNALKFMPSDVAPRIEIWTKQESGMLRVHVRDNGIGIDPESQAKIFRIFERLHDEQEYPGTGIGLGIVRKGTERMGGHVGVESAPGRGSCFWVELPVGPGV